MTEIQLLLCVNLLLIIIAILLFNGLKGIASILNQNKEIHATHKEWIEEAFEVVYKEKNGKVVVGDEESNEEPLGDMNILAEEALQNFDNDNNKK